MSWVNKAATSANWTRIDPPDVAVTDSAPAAEFWHVGWEGDFVSEVQLMGKKSDGTFELLKTDDAGRLGVALTGSTPVLLASDVCATAPAVGVKTVTATAAEIFAGAAVKAARRKLILKNEDPALRFRIGPATVTQQNGFPVEPGASAEVIFDPAVTVPIYAVSEGANLSVAVMEI